MLRAGWIVVAAVGCGRIGFDAIPAGSDAATGDASPPSSGLVAWYRLDDGTGTSALDSSGGGHDGDVTYCDNPYPTWTTGRFGGALELAAASSNCVSVSESPALVLAAGWTVSAWVALASIPAPGDAFALVVKPNFVSQHNYALFADHGYLGSAVEGWAVAFHDAAGVAHVIKVGTTFELGAWTQIGGTWDGATLTLFVNGVAAESGQQAAPPSATEFIDPELDLLGKNECCAQYLDGALDDVRIYNRALDAAEMASLYTAP